MSEISITPKLAKLPAVSHQAQQYLAESTSHATRRAYQADIRAFVQWCHINQLPALPSTPEVIANFLASEAEVKTPSTLSRRIAAIRYAHEAAGFESPTQSKLVSATLAGIRRIKGTKPKQKRAATVDKLYQLLAQINTKTLQGKRDKALLILGFAGAFRRSELADIKLEDIEFLPEGLRITITKSKTDQTGEGQVIAIYNGRLDVVGVLQDYLQTAGIRSSYIFRPMTKTDGVRPQGLTDKSVALIIKRYAAAAGMNPDEFAGHSLRAGFITSAAEAGANLFKIMDVSRHKNMQTVKRYVRQADLFKNHAGASFL